MPIDINNNMNGHSAVEKPESHGEKRDYWQAMLHGFYCKCPNCGEGKLFGKFVKVNDSCAHCGEELHHHKADDLPAYLVIFIVGHVVLGAFMAIDRVFVMESWQHMLIWLPGTAILTIALLQPMKGVVVGLQWALRMHGFGGDDELLDDLPEERQ